MAQLAIAALLILCNALFALSELAIVSSRKARLQALAKDGSRGARTALALIEKPGRFLSTVQIGISLVGILAGAFSGAALGADVSQWLRGLGVRPWLAETAGFTLVIGAITYFSVVIGELVPKHLALRNPEPIACAVAPAMAALSRYAAPLVWLLDGSTRLVMRALSRSTDTQSAVTDEEIRALVAEAARAGVIAADERKMIAAVMRFGDRNVRFLMTPRVNVDFLDMNDSPSQIRAKIGGLHHHCVPVAVGGVDHIIGIVRVRDLLAPLLEGRPLELREHVREALVVPDRVTALSALESLRRASLPMAIVSDEYGNFEGILTPADILDALAGAFRSDPAAREAEARMLADGAWLLAGSMPADEMADLLGIQLPPQRDYETCAGFIIASLTRIPERGETIDAFGWRFTVTIMDGRRIDQVRAEKSQDDA